MNNLWTLLVRFPLLALVPSAFFLACAARGRRRSGVVAAVAWAAYALYELGVSLRILCSGECNIRADLIVLYPVLIVLSVVGLGSMIFGGPRG
ncbi:MAG: hypothetical protein AMXMBFR53_08470 [Gemmatimonadota bacterium]